MTPPGRQRIRFSGISLQAIAIALTLAIACAVAPSAQAQKYKVIHNFTGGTDGEDPRAGLTRDQAGNFYGTTSTSVYKLTGRGSGWVLTPLYHFTGGSDGQAAWSPITIGPDGTLYGTTLGGGYTGGDFCHDGGCGVVYNVKPAPRAPASALTPWTETVLHAFTGPPYDGDQPAYEALMFDKAGNLYGTTNFGGNDYGAVFEMSPSNGGWTETILFGGFYWGNGYPLAGVVMDAAGNLYGTTENVIYELSPSPYGWVFTVLHAFTGGKDDGGLAYGGLIFDAQGNLYGATEIGGLNNGGVVYELSPYDGGWTYNVIYNLSGADGGPFGSLTLDAAGNLYGLANGDGINDAGMVFKLTQSNGTWSLTDLHDFSFDTAYFPYGGVAFDENGNLYGTASSGGVYGAGVIWEITP